MIDFIGLIDIQTLIWIHDMYQTSKCNRLLLVLLPVSLSVQKV